MRRMSRSLPQLVPVAGRPPGSSSPAPASRPLSGPDEPATPSGALVPVGPGLSAGTAGSNGTAESTAGARVPGATAPAAISVSELDVFGFPVQIGKVQPPLLPAETLARDRLLDWLAAKIHSRLTLIVADPGYGKTTLLADWSRRTRLRVLWYRLDETDRDWLVFVHHVVAAGREIDPAFAPNTASLLRELGAGMGNRTRVVRTLLAEISAWATRGTALLLDDYHLVDEAPEVREIVRELLLRGPDRLSVVISTRRRPTLPLARLRALGEVAEVTTADLRFDREELERLFRDTYRHPLEADLLDDLARTTEGWAATLRLVQTAIRGRPRHKVRAVIEGLSAQFGDLHDYLAEEVIGRMPPELQAFLERCSLLHVATPQLAAVAAAVSESDARRLLEVTEETGLISRRGRTGQAGRLLHPLVRSFLEGRLLDTVDRDGVAAIHARIAATAEPNSWWLAAHHFSAAGHPAEVARVLSGSLESILGSGGARAAVDLMAGAGIGGAAGWVFALEARAHLREGSFGEAREAAQEALAKSTLGDSTIPLTVALATLTTVEFNGGQHRVAVDHARRLREVAAGTVYEAIADSVLAIMESMVDGSVSRAAAALSHTAALARQLGHEHYFGISHLNLAWLLRGDGNADGVLASARLALDSLAATSAGPEMDTARTVAAWAHAHRGNVDRAASEVEEALASRFSRGRFEILLESADVLGAYVDPERGWSLVAEAEAVGPATAAERYYLQLVRAEALMRLGRPADAAAALAQIEPGRHTGYPGFYTRVALARATAALLAEATDTSRYLSEAARIIERQDARGMEKSWRLMESLASDPESASQIVVALWSVEPGVVVANAEAILARLGALEEPAIATVLQAAQARPSRWLPGLRRTTETGGPRAKWAAGRILEVVGERADVARLRALSRELRGQFRSPALGRALARRTADRVWVEDLGRIILRIGPRVVPGTSVRRRPLALLCLLLTRPGLSATRDQVLDALWPEVDPEQAVNSLHQTVYFLRRVVEPAYSDDLSPGYVHQDGELVWLDSELITSRSVRCRELLKSLVQDPSAGDVLAMAAEYPARFALDFSYDDWAAAYRDSLHARYLEVMERAIASASAAGRFLEAMEVSRAVLETDPSLDHIQASLVKLYRVLGAHAAAAEQYGQYASVMRHELGLEPPPLDSL